MSLVIDFKIVGKSIIILQENLQIKKLKFLEIPSFLKIEYA